MRTFFLITALLLLTGCEMPDGEAPQIEEVIWHNFRGWSPQNVPPADLYPRLLREGELIDARGVVVDPDGVIRWRRDQYMLPAVGQTLLDVYEYKASPSTVDKNQVLAFCDDGKLYKLETDWPNASASQSAYGYQLNWDDPGNGNYAFTEVASGLATSGRRGFCAARDVVLVGHRDEATKRWNGTDLTDVGFLPPSIAIGGADEDLTTYTENDTGGYLTVTADKVAVASMPRTADSWVNYDFASAYFQDFTHTFELTVASTSAADSGMEIYGICGIYGYTTGANGLSPGSAVDFTIRAVVGASDWLVRVYSDVVGGYGDITELALDTKYYFVVTRVDNDFTVQIYSDASHDTLVDELTLPCSTRAYRRIVVTQGWDLGSGSEDIDADLENLNLGVPAIVAGGMPSGTYSYYYTYGNSEWESMPSPIIDVPVTSDDKALELANITPGPSGTEWRRIYRAYTTDTTQGARGASFLRLTQIDDNTTTTYTDNALQATLGFPQAFDHAVPPRGDLLIYHNNRVFMANCSYPSMSYTDWTGELEVTGAGTSACNGTYRQVGIKNGKPIYKQVGANYWIWYTRAGFWYIIDATEFNGHIVYYHSASADVTGTWLVDVGAPAPTVTSSENEDNLDNVLFYSELDEPYYWPSTNYIRVGDNTPIRALVSWRDWLLIFKESSVWVLRGYNADDFQLAQLTNEYGCAHQNAAASGPPGVLWRDKGGLCFFNGVGIQVVLDYAISSTFGPPATTITQPTIAYHRSKFYILEGDYLLTYDPEPQRWSYREFKETAVGIRAFNFGRYQSHILSYWEWKVGSSYLGVLDTGKEFGHYDDQGSTTSVDEFAPVQITLPPLLARPGEEIVPVEVWVDGSWIEHATSTRRPYIYLNDDADYSSTAGQNAWETTPLAPKDGNVIGVPQGYIYDSTGKTNAYKTLYIQIKATEAEDFVLTAVGLRFKRRAARG